MTVGELIEIIKDRKDYEIVDGDNHGMFYYDGTYDFEIYFSGRAKTFGTDVLEQIIKENIPLDTDVCIWDSDDFHSWKLTHEEYYIDDENKLIILVCKPFQTKE